MKNARKLVFVTLAAFVIGAVFPYVNFALDPLKWLPAVITQAN